MFKTPFQQKCTETFYTPKIVDQDQQTRDHSRRHDHQRNERLKEPYNYTNEYEDIEYIPPEDIEKYCKDKKFQKVVEIFLNEEKEK